MKRLDERMRDQLRDIKIDIEYLDNPDGSCLFQMGNTKVICAASIQDSVPVFLRNKGSGWVTAEYEMLPHACSERGIRESTKGKRKGRSQEIQRIIGRVLRSAVDLDKIGERTIWVDCDVIQADGGTRTASITGGFIALYQALEELKKRNVFENIPIESFIAGVSVGIVDDEVLLDLAYQEDFKASVDLNLAMSEAGKLIEIQGTAEESPFDKEKLYKMIEIGYKGITELVDKQKNVLGVK